jgi:hypothetical protein
LSPCGCRLLLAHRQRMVLTQIADHLAAVLDPRLDADARRAVSL